ncbi:protein NO VEIN domain-containing protein [Stappia sp.]|uniref:protein NO VEIN domain-containing protein n=1 Tax=Stappia sp. TaxID=1870903 RepID=UPI003A9A4BF8
MNSEVKYGQDWTDDEIARTVNAYFEYLDAQRAGGVRPKLHVYKEIAEEIGRSHKSVERKFQNISAVLDVLGMEWISGLAPSFHYQQALADFIEEKIVALPDSAGHNEALGFGESPQLAYQPSGQLLIVEDMPDADPTTAERPDYIERLVRKFDPSIRDFRNRQLGRAGEEYVFQREVARLRAEGQDGLARKVDWIADSKGDGAGFDILSYESSGREKFIEVKTTVGSKRTPFFITRNEMEFSREASDSYSLVRLFDFRRSPKAFLMTHPIERSAIVSPENFKVSF